MPAFSPPRVIRHTRLQYQVKQLFSWPLRTNLECSQQEVSGRRWGALAATEELQERSQGDPRGRGLNRRRELDEIEIRQSRNPYIMILPQLQGIVPGAGNKEILRMPLAYAQADSLPINSPFLERRDRTNTYPQRRETKTGFLHRRSGPTSRVRKDPQALRRPFAGR